MPIVIDLFAGAGGLSLGSSRAGFTVSAAVEIDKHAIASHISNFPQTVHIQRDITTLSGKEILTLSGLSKKDVVGIIGGPPCQGFSSIGHGDVGDVRNQLFVKFFEIVSEIRPIFFVAENVPGIMNEKYNDIRKKAFSKINGYTLLEPILVDASDYGAPTTRTRYFFIGYLKSKKISDISIEDFENCKVNDAVKTNVLQALEGIPCNIKYSPRCSGIKKLMKGYLPTNHTQSDYFYQRVTGMIPDGIGNVEYIEKYKQNRIINGCLATKHSAEVRKRYSKLKYNQQDKISKSKRLNPTGFCPTLRAGTGADKGSYQAVRPIHFKYNRVITPREAARLQGFPDWYKLPDTIWHSFRQIGNSVSPIVAEQILSVIYQKLML